MQKNLILDGRERRFVVASSGRQEVADGNVYETLFREEDTE